ncbi:MAG: NAD(P) transhydrogenase subunit alpha [Acholeplasmataceae bacterium]|mgnify:CR=1 FL=1|jgi:NAD(P) transhydrogenase subunit alpha|nr:NAD(P) transhydrogenase subunit alpha [Acholeplasmataceae bacterium]
MNTLQIILLAIFIVASIIGYFLIKNVPSLLHTPLMSGMNAFSGITLIGAIVATSILLKQDPNNIFSIIVGSLAILGATINVSAGFLVTHRMLSFFKGGHHD